MRKTKMMSVILIALIAVVSVVGVTFGAWVYSIGTEFDIGVDSGEWDANKDNFVFEYVVDAATQHPVAYAVTGLKDDMKGMVLKIPAVHNNLPVTTITSQFANRQMMTSLRKLVIPASVTTIESDALSYISMLQYVEFIGDGLVDIGDRVFFQCNSLQNITLPKTLKTVGTDVLAECDNLTVIDVLAKASTINQGAAPINFGKKSDGTFPTINFGGASV